MKKAFHRIKFPTFLTLLLLCCAALTSCGFLSNYARFWQEISPEDTIDWVNDNTIRYNGTLYESIENTDGKITADTDSEDCVKIATMPFSYLLGAVSIFYADNAEDPDLIYCDRGRDVWVKAGMDIDEIIMQNTCVVSDTFSFRICDVITDEVIHYTNDYGLQRRDASFRWVPLEAYPAFSYNVDIITIDGELYLQYVWDSDFYKITDEFETDLRENGLLE